MLNCGYGHGYSVREVLDSVQRVAGRPIADPRGAAARGRSADVWSPRADRIRAVLGWKPQLDDLDTIVRTALRWEEKLLREPW